MAIHETIHYRGLTLWKRTRKKDYTTPVDAIDPRTQRYLYVINPLQIWIQTTAADTATGLIKTVGEETLLGNQINNARLTRTRGNFEKTFRWVRGKDD